MSEHEYIERAKEIINLYHDEEYDKARRKQEEFAGNAKGNVVLENPNVLDVHLILEFLTHERHTTSLGEAMSALATLEESVA